MAKYLELRRHADNEDDVLSTAGVRQALEIGAGLDGDYDLLVSSGAQRATQTLACFLASIGRKVPGGVVVVEGLRSQSEDRWRAAYAEAGKSDLEALRLVDPGLVEQDSAKLGSALLSVFDRVSDGARVLVVGHSPTNEAAVLGLTGQVVAPIAKGGGVLIEEENGRFRVERLR
ncbi:MAG TPA: histidine phosphatase family protein [Acidimicrobiales bacterium]|nr:histidine phosphatase family protein [Acidimicrobiales bacterium]